MFCPKCGCDNDQGVNCCANCGAALPRLEQMQSATTIKEHHTVNERLRVFEKAVDDVRSGQRSVEDFHAFLLETHEVLSAKEREIREIAIPEEASGDFQEELSIGFEGIALYNEGIAQMLEYAERLDETCLDDGLALVRQGNARINEAMRVNRENRNRLEEELSQNSLEIM